MNTYYYITTSKHNHLYKSGTANPSSEIAHVLFVSRTLVANVTIVTHIVFAQVPKSLMPCAAIVTSYFDVKTCDISIS